MLSTSVPTKIQIPFANTGAKNTIPVASQTATDPALASFADGFTTATMTPLAAGGKPPYGKDFNGILNAITAVQQYQCAGGIFTYDSAYASAIGGYPLGAIVQSTTRSKTWMSLVDNNLVNPDSGPSANWVICAGSFGATLASNGFQKLPSGLVMQWGRASTTSGAATVTFPYAFAAPPYQCFASLWLTTGGAPSAIVGCETGSSTQLRIAANNPQNFNPSGDGTTINWFAFGPM